MIISAHKWSYRNIYVAIYEHGHMAIYCHLRAEQPFVFSKFLDLGSGYLVYLAPSLPSMAPVCSLDSHKSGIDKSSLRTKRTLDLLEFTLFGRFTCNHPLLLDKPGCFAWKPLGHSQIPLQGLRLCHFRMSSSRGNFPRHTHGRAVCLCTALPKVPAGRFGCGGRVGGRASAVRTVEV